MISTKTKVKLTTGSRRSHCHEDYIPTIADYCCTVELDQADRLASLCSSSLRLHIGASVGSMPLCRWFKRWCPEDLLTRKLTNYTPIGVEQAKDD